MSKWMALLAWPVVWGCAKATCFFGRFLEKSALVEVLARELEEQGYGVGVGVGFQELTDDFLVKLEALFEQDVFVHQVGDGLLKLAEDGGVRGGVLGYFCGGGDVGLVVIVFFILDIGHVHVLQVGVIQVVLYIVILGLTRALLDQLDALSLLQLERSGRGLLAVYGIEKVGLVVFQLGEDGRGDHMPGDGEELGGLVGKVFKGLEKVGDVFVLGTGQLELLSGVFGLGDVGQEGRGVGGVADGLGTGLDVGRIGVVGREALVLGDGIGDLLEGQGEGGHFGWGGS